MSIDIDLLDKIKSKIRIVFGCAIVVFSCSWLFYNLNEKEVFSFFDWAYFAGFLLFGLVYLIEGTGTSIMKFFGAKAHVLIDDEKIVFKPEAISKETRVEWKEITAIAYKAARYEITKSDNSSLKIDLPTENYALVQNIKGAINSISEKHKITVK